MRNHQRGAVGRQARKRFLDQRLGFTSTDEVASSKIKMGASLSSAC
ncbi:MAG: hypothetical protein R2911_07650 [Caldilineaceae bacterium]